MACTKLTSHRDPSTEQGEVKAETVNTFLYGSREEWEHSKMVFPLLPRNLSKFQRFPH